MQKKKKLLANLIMVAIIAVIFAACILFVGYIRGWFGNGSDSAAVLADVRGIVNITRNGVTYPVEQDTTLRKGDIITCTPGGTAAIRVNKGSALAIGEQAEIRIEVPETDKFSIYVSNGELFALAEQDAEPISLSYELGSAVVSDAVVSLSVHTGSQTLNVFSGKAAGADAGETIYYVINQEPQTAKLAVSSLNSFSIAQLRAANTVFETAVSNAELDELEAKRAEEKTATSMQAMSEELAELDFQYECTLTILCRTILDNRDKLNEAKAEFVPEDGTILAKVQVPFAEGETAFDATKRACDAYDIQIEYSWTPLYNSYYVEGINHLYEFDVGPESGWMYRVNGWFPNYGASAYILNDGDDIVWEYTCVGLGADVGGYVG